MTEIKIIRCNPDNKTHFSKLEDAYSKLFNERENLKVLSLSNVSFDSHTISAFLKNSSDKDVAYCAAVTPINDIVGISAFECDPIRSFQVIGVVVDNDYRYKGVGTALINKGIEIARKKGFKAIDIDVFVDNKAMLILLINMDFKIVKLEYHARFDGEDIVHLKKYL